jgi:hypothetical protein
VPSHVGSVDAFATGCAAGLSRASRSGQTDGNVRPPFFSLKPMRALDIVMTTEGKNGGSFLWAIGLWVITGRDAGVYHPVKHTNLLNISTRGSLRLDPRD